MASWDVVLIVVYPIPDRISDGYLIWDRIYYGRLFISSKNKLVQWNTLAHLGIWSLCNPVFLWCSVVVIGDILNIMGISLAYAQKMLGELKGLSAYFFLGSGH